MVKNASAVNIKGKTIPPELNEFNWGAFLLTFIWGIKYKAKITYLVVPLMLIQLPLCLNWVLLVILQFYCGFKGNQWAYETEYWRKPVDFRKTQEKWAIAAITSSILIPLIFISLALKFINKSDDNLMNYMRNRQCRIANDELTKKLPKLQSSAMATPNQMAKEYSKLYPKSKASNNIATIELKRGAKYDFIFKKLDGKNCNLYSKNCIIQVSYNFGIEDNLFDSCTFYFDQANLQPESETQKYINEDSNLIKYF